jgi:hypothetical protein
MRPGWWSGPSDHISRDIAALADRANEFGDMPVLTKPFTALGGKVKLGPDGSVHGSRNLWPRA